MVWQRIYLGDIHECIDKLVDDGFSNSVDCCITSPPYWGLRSYLPTDHPLKKLEIGLEEHPQEYINKIAEIFDFIGKTLLKKSGTMWVNLGDTFYGGGGGHQYSPENAGFLSKAFKANPEYERIAGFDNTRK